MSVNTLVFAVKVVVKNPYSKTYRCDKGRHIYDETIKTYHIESRSIDTAFDKAMRYGRPLSCRKVSFTDANTSIEAKDKDGNYIVLQGIETPYKNAVDMNYFIWNRKKNKEKDRKDIDKE